jgi:polyferredoxin
MDACDTIMDSVGLEKGLIRVVSENGIKNRTSFQWTKRVIAYTVLLATIVGVLVLLLLTRKDFETTIMRQRGTTYQMVDGKVNNIFEVHLINKTQKDYKVELELIDDIGTIETVVKNLKLERENVLKERFIVQMPLSEIGEGKRIIHIRVLGNGKEIQRVKTKFIGPSL